MSGFSCSINLYGDHRTILRTGGPPPLPSVGLYKSSGQLAKAIADRYGGDPSRLTVPAVFDSIGSISGGHTTGMLEDRVAQFTGERADSALRTTWQIDGVGITLILDAPEPEESSVADRLRIGVSCHGREDNMDQRMNAAVKELTERIRLALWNPGENNPTAIPRVEAE